LTGETDDPESDAPDEALTADEREVLEHFRQLTSKDQAAARQLIRSLAERDADEGPVSTTVHSPPRPFSGPSPDKGRAA
jgi:hypothetical protein